MKASEEDIRYFGDLVNEGEVKYSKVKKIFKRIKSNIYTEK